MIRLMLLGILAALMQQDASAQAKSRPATAIDFTGVFQLLPYPTEKQPKFLKGDPWPAPCQFFGRYAGGYWLHEQQTQLQQGQAQAGACKTSIPKNKPALPQTVTWKLIKDGFVVIDRSDYKIQELWKVDHINAPANVDNINLNEGDVIMQMLDRSGKQIIWIRLLRKVGDTGN
jgi:hypothetical protein